MAVTTIGASGLAQIGTEPARGLPLISGWRRTSKGQPMASGKKNAVARAVAVGATVEVDAAVAAACIEVDAAVAAGKCKSWMPNALACGPPA